MHERVYSFGVHREMFVAPDCCCWMLFGRTAVGGSDGGLQILSVSSQRDSGLLCVYFFDYCSMCVCVCGWLVGGPYAFPAWFSPNRDLFVMLSGGPVDGCNDDDGDNARWQRGVVVMR